jgi:hypothetical protein
MRMKMENGSISHIGNSKREEKKPPSCRGKAGGGKHRVVSGVETFSASPRSTIYGTLHTKNYLISNSNTELCSCAAYFDKEVQEPRLVKI